jgi:hypothetical protein
LWTQQITATIVVAIATIALYIRQIDVTTIQLLLHLQPFLYALVL